MSHSERAGRAAFTRPERLSPAASEFSIRINQINAIADIPKVRRGSPFEIDVSTSHMPQSRLQQNLLVVPRLPSQVSDGFYWQDVQTDLTLALSQSDLVQRNSPQHRLRTSLNLAAGDYVVRYYIQTFEQTDGVLPKVEYMGEGKLLVEEPAPENTGDGLIPLEHKEGLIPLLSEDSEE